MRRDFIKTKKVLPVQHSPPFIRVHLRIPLLILLSFLHQGPQQAPFTSGCPWEPPLHHNLHQSPSSIGAHLSCASTLGMPLYSRVSLTSGFPWETPYNRIPPPLTSDLPLTSGSLEPLLHQGLHESPSYVRVHIRTLFSIPIKAPFYQSPLWKSHLILLPPPYIRVHIRVPSHQHPIKAPFYQSLP